MSHDWGLASRMRGRVKPLSPWPQTPCHFFTQPSADDLRGNKREDLWVFLLSRQYGFKWRKTHTQVNRLHPPLCFVSWAEDTASIAALPQTVSQQAVASLHFTALKSTRIRRLWKWGRLNRTFSVGAQKQPDQQQRVIGQLPEFKTGSVYH